METTRALLPGSSKTGSLLPTNPYILQQPCLSPSPVYAYLITLDCAPPSVFSNSEQTLMLPTFTFIDLSTLIKKAQANEATGGQPCGKTTSQSFKVRKNDGSGFVGAFCQSNVGDVTPNVLGAFCTNTGKPCDFNRSSCNGNDLLCVGRGPGYI